MQRLMMTLLVIGTLIPAVSAQSLGDLARKRKGDEKPGGKVITNRDLVKEPATGAKDTEAIRAEIERLHSEDPKVRAEAIVALRRMGPAASPAIPDLVQLGCDQTRVKFRDSNVIWTISEVVLMTLGDMGEVAESALMEVFNLPDQTDRSRAFVITELGNHGTRSGLLFLEHLENDPTWKKKAAKAIEEIRSRLNMVPRH